MEQSDADFYHKMMPHDTDGKNRYKEKNNGKFHLFSSGWKNGENHLFPSHWKFGPYGQKNGGGINTIPPPRALRRAYAVSCRETKNPNPLPTANRFGFLDFGGDKRDRTADLLNAIQALSQSMISMPPPKNRRLMCAPRRAAYFLIPLSRFSHGFSSSNDLIICPALLPVKL